MMQKHATSVARRIPDESRLVVATCVWLPASTGLAQTGNEGQVLDDASKGLSQLLDSLKRLTKQLPDRSLSGNVRVAWDLDESHEASWRRGGCTTFGTFSLKPSSMEGYPIGQWSSRDGRVNASTSMRSEWAHRYQPRRRGPASASSRPKLASSNRRAKPMPTARAPMRSRPRSPVPSRTRARRSRAPSLDDELTCLCIIHNCRHSLRLS